MRLFITGTDTNVGKTYVSCLLLKSFEKLGFTTIAMKPLASGCEQTANGLVNQDALLLQEHATIKLAYDQVNPLRFEPPVAPHIPAQLNNINLTSKQIVAACQPALNTPADIHLIEGVGGWLMPLNSLETMADVAYDLQAKIVLVVGMRLGCLNHALLTLSAIQQKSCSVLGWIANCIEPEMPYCKENIDLLRQTLTVPLLDIVAFDKS